MRLPLLCALVVGFVCSGVIAHADFTGWVLVSTVVSPEQRESMEYSIPHVDVWREQWSDSTKSSHLLEVFLSPEGLGVLKEMGVEHTVLDTTVQQKIEEERERLERRPRLVPQQINPVEFFQDYRPLDEIYDFCDNYLMPLYGNLMTRFELGRTIEGRIIRGYRITTDASVQKPGVYLGGLVHAREWLAPAAALFEVNALLEDYSNNNPEVIALLNGVEIHYVPIVNQDGYTYSWEVNRLWRKNRRPNAGGSFGVDLNRNWGPNNTWCTAGSSTFPTSDTYCGTAAFSEPEVEAQRAYIDSLGIFRAGLDYHTYGALILWPYQYSYDRIPEPDYSEFARLGAVMEAALNVPFNIGYSSIQGVDLYPHSGGFIDYNYEESGMYAFTMEGRGPNFTPPPSDIVPSGIENYEALKVIMRYVIDNP